VPDFREPAVSLVQDLAYSHRFLKSRLGFTFAAALTLALGIGANTAVFSILHAVLVRPLPIEDPDRVVLVNEADVARGVSYTGCSQRAFSAIRERRDLFEAVTAVYSRIANLAGIDEPATVRASQTDAAFVRAIGIQPFLGRWFRSDETQAGSPEPVAVLGYDLWRRRFGGDPGVIGRVVRLDDQATTIIGVMPATENWLDSDLFIPLQPVVTAFQTRRMLGVFGRLRPDVSMAQAAKALTVTAANLAKAWPETQRGWTIAVHQVDEMIVTADARRNLLLLGAAVVLVLLIACVNLTGLLLARAVGRRREIAIHAALGASRLRMIRRLLTESLMLAALGGGAGVLLAMWGVSAFQRLAAGRIPRLDAAGVDTATLTFTAALAIGSGLAAGLVPALQAARAPVSDALKEASISGTAGKTRQRLRAALVVAEIALAVALLSGAGLLIRSLLRANHVDAGVEIESRYAITVNLPPKPYEQDARVVNFWRTLLERVRAVPGVIAAGATSDRWLLAGRRIIEYNVEGNLEVNRRVPAAECRTVTPGYFETLGIPLLEGRLFDGTERGTVQDPESKRSGFVVLVSKTLAKRQWPGESAVGKRIQPFVGDDERFWSTVIGVVDDIRQSAVTESPVPSVYLPEYQYAWLRLFLLVHATDMSTTLPAVRAAIQSIDAALPADDVVTLDEVLAESLTVERAMTAVLVVFAAVAILLAAVGVYGQMSYSVACRTQEFGIRLALGATRRDVRRLVLREGITLAAAGVAIGLPIAFAVGLSFRAILFEVSPADPLTYVLVTVLLLAVAAAACFVPGWRATHVDPALALRAE
jgi:putative ABC transport system permease protein